MLFYEIINDHPAEDPALICQDKMLTYGEVREEVTLWAAHLQRSGVCKGDKVGLFSKNCNEFVIAYLAIIKAGGVVVPFNFQLAAPEVAYIVQDAGMRVMVTRQKLEMPHCRNVAVARSSSWISRICVSLLTGVMKI